MAEEKREKKKFKIFKQILKWTGLGLLALLLIAAIIFQAPWKVITLLVIILLACTVLPKQMRKWFWLSVGGVAIALIIWVFLPEKAGDWRPYTFDEELAAIEAKRAIPDEENAARLYNVLLESYDSKAMYPDFLKNRELDRATTSEAWSSKNYPQIAEWLKGHQGTIETLLEASKIEKCQFAVAADSAAFGQHMKILAPMRNWARLLVRAANNDLGEGRIDQALEKQIAVLQMAKHQSQQPTMIDTLVGIAIEALAIKQFNRFIVTGDATEERLRFIEEALTEIKHNWSSDLLRILEGEKLMAKNMLCSMAYEVNPKGKVRLSRDPTAAMRLEFPKEVPPLTYWQMKRIKASIILWWFFVPSTPQKAAEIINVSYEKLHAMAEPDFDWQKEPKKFSLTSAKFNYRFMTEMMLFILEPAYYRVHEQYLRVTSDHRGSLLLIALRRYKNKNGVWPESLDDIKSLAPAEIFVDPINGNSFVYKLTEENFKLYSKGKNNIDEDGKRDKWDEEKTGADDWLIWPRKSRRK